MLNFIKSGISSSLESINLVSNVSHSVKPLQNSFDLEKIIEQILKIISENLTEKIGQKIDLAEQIINAQQIIKVKSLQECLIETKQKYNELVDKSTFLFQQARKISNTVAEFVTSINLYLESEQLLIPLKQIQKGINELIPEKVQKHMNYLVKLFQTNFQQIVQKKKNQALINSNEEIKALKALNKNIENELLNFKNTKRNQQSKYFEQSTKITELIDKINKLNFQKAQIQRTLKAQSSNAALKQKMSSQHEKQIVKFKNRQSELLEKIKKLELNHNKLQRQNRQKQNQTLQANNIIEKLKAKQEEVIENLQIQYKKKETHYETIRKKMYLDKTFLQEKIQMLTQKNQNLQKDCQLKMQEIKSLSQKIIDLENNNLFSKQIDPTDNKEINGGIESKSQMHHLSFKEVKDRIEFLQLQNKQLLNKLESQAKNNVNKQVLKSLILSYDDESKQWSIKMNIRNQIYNLLGLIENLPKEIPKQSKWFGLF